MPKTYTPKEIVQILQVSENTLRMWRSKNIGPPWIQLVGVVRYPAASFEAWLRDSAQNPDEDNKPTPGA